MKQKTIIIMNKVTRPIRVIKEKKSFNPTKYRGIYKDLRFDLEGEIETYCESKTLISLF